MLDGCDGALLPHFLALLEELFAGRLLHGLPDLLAVLDPLIKGSAEFQAGERDLFGLKMFDLFDFKFKDQPFPLGGHGGITVYLLVLFSCFSFLTFFYSGPLPARLLALCRPTVGPMAGPLSALFMLITLILCPIDKGYKLPFPGPVALNYAALFQLVQRETNLLF